MIFETCIVVGHGSIGKFHAKTLSQISNSMVIVDPKTQLIDYGLPTKHFDSLQKLPSSNSQKDLAIVSNWGPDHFSTVLTLISKGYKNLILEKPMVTSLSDLDQLQSLVKNGAVKIAINQGWHYENLANRINNLANKFSLGPVVAIWINGGARCISTAGSHYIHLAKSIFGELPTSINASLNLDKINPRSTDLLYIDGVATIRFGRKLLSMSYSNLSSIEGNVSLLWKEAIGNLNGTNISIDRRLVGREYENIITRYGPPTQNIFDNTIPDLVEHSSDRNSIYSAFTDMSQESMLESFEQHASSNRALLYCLISNHLNREIQFNDSSNKLFADMKFSIS